MVRRYLSTAAAAVGVSAALFSGVAYAGPPSVQSEPPGQCFFEEETVVKVGPDGALYECQYVRGEGRYYWIVI